MTTDRGHRFEGAPSSSREIVRASRGRVGTVVGITMTESMLMTPGAQANEMKRIDTDMRAFGDELAAAAAAHGDTAPRPPRQATAQQIIDYTKAIAAQPAAVAEAPIVTLYRAAWIPLWHTWTTFYTSNKDGAWWSNPVSEAEAYQKQLADIRTQASALGIKLQTPGPTFEHPEGLPTWLLPVGVGVGALVVLSILTRHS